MPTLSTPMPSGLPNSFVDRLRAVQDKDLSAQGTSITKAEMEHVLKGLDGVDDVKKAEVGAWLEANSGTAFTLADDASASAVKAFVEAHRAPASAPASTTTTTASRAKPKGLPRKLPAELKAAIERGFSLAVSRDEVLWKPQSKRPNEQAPADFWGGRRMTLPIQGQDRSVFVFLSTGIGLNGDTPTDDWKKAERFVIFDAANAKVSDFVGLAKTQQVIVDGGGPNPALDATEHANRPALTSGGKLSWEASFGIERGIGLLKRDDEYRWRTTTQPPSERDHFMPPYTMNAEGSDGNDAEMLVYFSKRAQSNLMRAPSEAKFATSATLYNPATDEILRDIPISLPARVTLPVV